MPFPIPAKNNKTKQALEYVEYVRSNPCRGGTEEVLPVQFNHSMWEHYAQVSTLNPFQWDDITISVYVPLCYL